MENKKIYLYLLWSFVFFLFIMVILQITILIKGENTSIFIYIYNLYIKKETISEHIINLYDNYENKLIVNNDIIEYQLADKQGLMKDRFGDELSPINSGNIRYYGKNPKNYIDIGDRKNLYRIVGLFKNVKLSDGSEEDLVKVIKDQPIGNYSWDTSSINLNFGFGVDSWSNAIFRTDNSKYTGADLMNLLNPGYHETNGSLWWNQSSGSCYNGVNNSVTKCDFSKNGLNNKSKQKIEEVVWNLGGTTSSKLYPNEIYQSERGSLVSNNNNDYIIRPNPPLWKGKVALPYPSDYGYASDLNLCKNNLYEFTSDECIKNNWIYNNKITWLLTPQLSNTNVWKILRINQDGHINKSEAANSYSIRPTFYLKKDLIIKYGNGSKKNPYKI